MPPRSKRGIDGIWVFAVVLCGFGYVVFTASSQVQAVTAVLVGVFCWYTAIANRRDRNRFATLANTRGQESICQFARSFETRRTDTWIIRAAYQEIQRSLHLEAPHFPIRAADALVDDLRFEPEDVDDLIIDIAERAGYSLTDTRGNPYFGRVHTVADLVLFVNAQARGRSV